MRARQPEGGLVGLPNIAEARNGYSHWELETSIWEQRGSNKHKRSWSACKGLKEWVKDTVETHLGQWKRVSDTRQQVGRGGWGRALLEGSQPGLQCDGNRKTSVSHGGFGIRWVVRCTLKLRLFDAHGVGSHMVNDHQSLDIYKSKVLPRLFWVLVESWQSSIFCHLITSNEQSPCIPVQAGIKSLCGLTHKLTTWFGEGSFHSQHPCLMNNPALRRPCVSWVLFKVFSQSRVGIQKKNGNYITSIHLLTYLSIDQLIYLLFYLCRLLKKLDTFR